MQKYLPNINSPSDLKSMKIDELVELCAEIREFLIDKCSQNPGHVGSSLGVVELTVALHYVFDTPYDKLVWDVGHQSYAHKIITGRRDKFSTNRKYGGISGFPKMSESEYDAFGGGHASVSISAAFGMAIAAKMNNEDRNVIAVIGDGSMTGGLAFEGLNNAGYLKPNMLVVLNDNNIAIDKSVGAMGRYLLKISTSRSYNKLKENIWNLLGQNFFRNILQKFFYFIKFIIINGNKFHRNNIFESLGFRYFGAFDGHDLPRLVKTLEKLKNVKGPKLLHVVTQKGKGFKPAEENQTDWHAPGKFNKNTGERIVVKSDKTQPLRYQDVFGKTIIELARQNPKIIGITPAMPTGCSLNLMMEEMPNRCFDAGIAEGHAVTFSAGLATMGLLPFCNIYSSFMQRAYDNIIHDVAIQKLNVVFCLDRSGLVGEDGSTHHGAYDLAYLRCIPNMIIASPMNEVELRNMMFTAQLPNKGCFAIRYPKGGGVIADWQLPFQEIPIAKARTIRSGTDIAILSIGHVGNNVEKAIEMLNDKNISAAHYDMRFVKPIDEELLHFAGKNFKQVITVENGTIIGGFGSAVSEFFAQHNYNIKHKFIGIPDKFVLHGSIAELQAECGFDPKGIANAIIENVK
ncbi:MAG: 1-deoxy-D-xylulose-5-phosphate synthase [Prevotellaceae bacterium]|jgi:1-deoxy-D-xylulose-5-phosphate synthase|nr:1-deoxy-D-xylulose-5-phosphate synthase [Prevotellaceae bacterium]